MSASSPKLPPSLMLVTHSPFTYTFRGQSEKRQKSHGGCVGSQWPVLHREPSSMPTRGGSARREHMATAPRPPRPQAQLPTTLPRPVLDLCQPCCLPHPQPCAEPHAAGPAQWRPLSLHPPQAVRRARVGSECTVQGSWSVQKACLPPWPAFDSSPHRPWMGLGAGLPSCTQWVRLGASSGTPADTLWGSAPGPPSWSHADGASLPGAAAPSSRGLGLVESLPGRR